MASSAKKKAGLLWTYSLEPNLGYLPKKVENHQNFGKLCTFICLQVYWVHYALYCLSPVTQYLASRKYRNSQALGEGALAGGHLVGMSTWSPHQNFQNVNIMYSKWIPNQQILALLFCPNDHWMTLNEWNYMMLVAQGVTRKSTSSIPNQRLRSLRAPRQRWPTSPWCWRWPGAIASFRQRCVTGLKCVEHEFVIL